MRTACCLIGVLISTNHDGKVKNRLALLTPDEKGVWKIDFDAFARTVEPSWEEIVGGRADEALVRVIVARDSYFNAAFSDDTKWESFGMASPDHDGVLLGYAATGSPQAQALGRILAEENAQEGSKPMRRVTLKLKRVEGAEPGSSKSSAFWRRTGRWRTLRWTAARRRPNCLLSALAGCSWTGLLSRAS